MNKGLLTRIGETLDQYRAERHAASAGEATPQEQREQREQRMKGGWGRALRWFLPNGGTLLLVALLIVTVNVWARPSAAPTATSVTTIPYQGRLADLNGNPVTDRVNMEFRLYDVPTGGTPLWEEFWTGGNAVNVSDGLFSVMLGSIETGLVEAVQGHDELYLGITVGTDSEMEPRVQLGSVPFAVWSLTVADDSITADKIATDAVGGDEIAAGAVGTEEIADGAVTTRNITAFTDEIIDASCQSTAGTVFDDFGSTSLNFNLPYQAVVYVYLRGSVRNDAGRSLLTLNIDGQDHFGNHRLYIETIYSTFRTMGTGAIFTLNAGEHIIHPRFGSLDGSTATVCNVAYGYIVLGQTP